MSVEFILKLRDAAQMMADAANDYLEKQVPKNVKVNAEDFNKLSWTEKEGSRSPYEQTTKEANQNSDVFQALQQKLSEHDGFWENTAYKYWNHQGDKDTIDRRKK